MPVHPHVLWLARSMRRRLRAARRALVVLAEVEERLSDHAHWSREASCAEDEHGREVDPADPSARRWTLLGALMRHTPTFCARGVTTPVDVLFEAMPGSVWELERINRDEGYEGIFRALAHARRNLEEEWMTYGVE